MYEVGKTNALGKTNVSVAHEKTNGSITWRGPHESTTWEKAGGTCTWETASGYTAREDINGVVPWTVADHINASKKPLKGSINHEPGYQRRVEVLYQSMDVKPLIDAEIKRRKGRVMVVSKSDISLIPYWLLIYGSSMCGPLDGCKDP